MFINILFRSSALILCLLATFTIVLNGSILILRQSPKYCWPVTRLSLAERRFQILILFQSPKYCWPVYCWPVTRLSLAGRRFQRRDSPAVVRFQSPWWRKLPARGRFQCLPVGFIGKRDRPRAVVARTIQMVLAPTPWAVPAP